MKCYGFVAKEATRSPYRIENFNVYLQALLFLRNETYTKKG